jgi:hypothetical protein
MLKRLLIPSVAAAALALSATVAQAGSFVIDTFNNPESELVRLRVGRRYGSVDTFTQTGIDVNETIGGSRVTSLELIQNSNNSSLAASTLTIPQPFFDEGEMRISNGPGVLSIARVFWDANGQGLNNVGQGDILDKLQLETDAISVNLLSYDNLGEYTFTIGDSLGETASITTSEIRYENIVVFELLGFLENNPNLNLRSVSFMELAITGPDAFDARISLVQGLEIPEPFVVSGAVVSVIVGFASLKRKSEDDGNNEG